MPVWATEAGYSGSATSIDPKNWLTAFGFAESYYHAIAWSHASRVYHWSLLGFDGAVGKQGERYPMLYALKHFTNYIPAGSVLIESQADDPQVFTLAFQRPDGMYSIILLNRLRAPRAIAIAGLTGEISQVVTSSDKAYEVSGTLADDGALSPLSITSTAWQP